MSSKEMLKKSLGDVLPMKDKGGEIFILLSPRNSGNERIIMGYGVTPVGMSVQRHTHSYSEECFFVIEGEGNIVFEDGDIVSFKENDAVRVPQNTAHAIENTGVTDLRVIFASGPLAPTMQEGHINGGSNEKNS